MKIENLKKLIQNKTVNNTTDNEEITFLNKSDGHFVNNSCGSVAKTADINTIIPVVLRLNLNPYHKQSITSL